jgi:S-adenosylmethionine:tRNA ribosyltransferase-isomerase
MIDFELPKELIAQEPASPRDSARLLVYSRADKTIIDTVFSELPKYLDANTTLVVNNSKVENCRWLFDSGKTEIFVLEKLDTHTIRALIRPGSKFKIGQKSAINDWLSVETTAIDDDGIRTLKLNIQHDDNRLRAVEHVPLPPYIAQNDTLAEEYQTIYAKPLGSKAAPTAGLHFTDKLLNKIRSKHDYLEVTLHVGLGTFANLTDENYETGKLHAEWYEIKPEIADRLQSAKHITAVGTTTVRTLESWAVSGDLMSSTDIFIQPGFKFKAVNSMITNFHLPGTSLLLMVASFVGSETELQRIYDHAIAENYRFYSFGDAMLIL